MKVFLQPLYSQLNPGVGKCPLGCQTECQVAPYLQPPLGCTCPLSSHQAKTCAAVTQGDADIIFNNAATSDGKSLAAFLRGLLNLGFRTMGLYSTIELVEDQTAQQKHYHALEKPSVPAQTVEQVILMGPQITGDALVYALELGMPVHYLSIFGKYLGSALPGYSRNGQLRLAQYAVYHDEKRRLELVKAIATAKIHNQYAVLYRHGQKDNPLKLRKQLVKEQTTLMQLEVLKA